MKKIPDFEEYYFSATAEGIFKYDQYSIRIIKRLCYADRPFYWKCKLLCFDGNFFNLS